MIIPANDFIMDITNRAFFNDFLKTYDESYKAIINDFIKKLSGGIIFSIKCGKASIQLIDRKPFGALAFRRSCNYIIFEFYNESIIDNNKIFKTHKVKEGLFIHTIHIRDNSEVDDNLINWFLHSHNIITRN